MLVGLVNVVINVHACVDHIKNEKKREEKFSPVLVRPELNSPSLQRLSPSIPAAESSKLHERAIATALFSIRITRGDAFSFIHAPSSGDR